MNDRYARVQQGRRLSLRLSGDRARVAKDAYELDLHRRAAAVVDGALARVSSERSPSTNP